MLQNLDDNLPVGVKLVKNADQFLRRGFYVKPKIIKAVKYISVIKYGFELYFGRMLCRFLDTQYAVHR